MLRTNPMSHKLCMLPVVLGFEQTTEEKTLDMSKQNSAFH